jgi:methionyl-tRNA formyltransferase
VYTREDKPVGRKQVLTAPPVKQVALAHGIPVFQPRTLKDEAAVQPIRELAPDLIVVVAYGRILPQAVLDIPRLGAVNLHVSLLPKYRGAAPVQWSVLNGDTQTGVTIMRMDAGLDTGDILCTQTVDIGADTTSGELFEQVTQIGAALLCTAMDDIEQGKLTPVPQDDALATLAPPLTKEMAQFTFANDAQTLHNLVRGLNPWPVAHFVHDGKKIKVLRSAVTEGKAGSAGEVLSIKPLVVACKEGALTLLEVVPEGSRPMEGSAWAAGRRFRVGDHVGDELCL